MDVDVRPHTFVRKSAWYSVSSRGNQADFAMSKLAQDAGQEYHIAKEVLTKFRYVDDSIPSCNTLEQREAMLEQTEQLSKINFKLKYVIRSGQPPPEGASFDSKIVKTLGYVWATEDDLLFPAYGKINFNPKKRGAKNLIPSQSSHQMMSETFFNKFAEKA